MKIINVVGARPNYMKIAPLLKAYDTVESIIPLIVHTGQHYDEEMSGCFFSDLKIRTPDIYLNIGSDTHARQVAKIMTAFEGVCLQERPDAILVVGDVNSTMACALVASKLRIKTVHLEAGLRSYDRTMPEEINRIVTDRIAEILLTPSADADENLRKEGVPNERIHRVGNIMIDTLCIFNPLAQKSKILNDLKIAPNNYALTTLHRPSNVDDADMFKEILDSLNKIAYQIPVVFPVHPRTKKIIKRNNLEPQLGKIIITEPLGYLDFMKLMSNAKFVITDSGGIQEETTALKIPCITLRENTERPITINKGSNELAGTDMNKLLFLAKMAIDGKWKAGKVPELWDGNTADRVLDVLVNNINL